MKNILKRIDKKVLAFSVTGFALFFALALLFPYSGDDWAWGSQIGIERLNTWFRDYNGRYAGNLLVLLLTRSKVLSAAFVSASVIIFGIIAYSTLKFKNFLCFLLAYLLFLTMPSGIFSQSIAWTSGFSNYVPSILMTLFCFVLLQRIFEKEKPLYPIYFSPILLVTAFISSLFMETVTILNVSIAFLIILYSLIKFKKLFIAQVAFLTGSLAGALYMFSNGAYKIILHSEDGYRETAFSGKIIDFLDSVFTHGNQIFSGLVLNNILTFFIISTLCIITGIKYLKTSNSKYKKALILSDSAVNILCLFILFAKKNYPYWLFFTHFRSPAYHSFSFFYGVTALFMLTAAIQVLICIEDKCVRDKLIFYLICTFILVVPLFIVDPIGPRCFFAPYITLVLFELIYINYLLVRININKNTLKHLSLSVTAGIIAMTLFFFTIYIPVNHYAGLRDEYVKSQINNNRKVIYVCNLPYSSFVWTGNPADNELLRDRYLLYNGLETDAEFVGKDYYEFEVWAKKYSKKTNFKPKHKLRKIKTRFYKKPK